MDEIGSFTPEQCRLLWQWYQESKQLRPEASQNLPQRATYLEPSPHRLAIYNGSGEEIPPYGCCEIYGTLESADRTLVMVRKPTNICGEYCFNSPYPIPIGAAGWAYRFGMVLMRGSASSYAACKRYAPVVGTWGIIQGPGPFLVYGQDFKKSGVVLGRIVGDHCKARWIQFSYDPESPSIAVDNYWDGPNPESCGAVNVEFPLGEPCKQADVIAFYDPNTNTYQAVDTQASMLGEPEDTEIATNVIAGSGCTITKTIQSMKAFPCDSTPTITVMNIGSQIDVITDVIEFPTYLRFYKKTITVCDADDAAPRDLILTECIDIYGGGA